MNNEPKVKQVIVIRKDLNMRKGKMVAQASHASMAFMTSQMRRITDEDSYESGWHVPNRSKNDPVCRYIVLDEESAEWLDGSHTKIVVYVNSEEELLDIHNKAMLGCCRSHLIQDSGRTEFHGVPTYTCVAIGPNYIGRVDNITKHLPLL